jgi:glutamate carboxypeptidase
MASNRFVQGRRPDVTQTLVKLGAAFLVAILAASALRGQAVEPVLARAKQERAAYIETLRALVSIESGSRDIEGLDRISDLIAMRLRALGGAVQFIAPGNSTRFDDTPPRIGRMVQARFTGTGTRKILLLAHMDTVYQKGMGAKQPFRVEGNRAYGLGVADDKQGVALILHTVAILNGIGFKDYGTLTVLINGDEEISSPGARAVITRLGREHDLVLSCEGGGSDTNEAIRLATTGSGDVLLRVTGRASHAGQAPEQGRNALYELANQILQMRDLSDPRTGVKLNWTVASAGTVRNMIPPSAQAMADVRVQRIADWDDIEAKVRERVKKTLIPDTKVDVIVERRRPPLQPTEAARRVADQARRIYAELGRTLTVATAGGGGATDAAFAAMESKGAVLEGFGLPGFGSHSNDAEYVYLNSVEPRLYLLTRTVMDAASGKIEPK